MYMLVMWMWLCTSYIHLLEIDCVVAVFYCGFVDLEYLIG